MTTRPGSWITDAAGLGATIARRALLDVGITEDPPGSNRSPEIDDYLKRVGCPVGQPWCAAAVSAWFRDCGAAVPPKLGASTDEWMRWAKEHQLWTSTPGIGCAVVYGKGEDAEHIGVVVRLTPRAWTVEGNTSLGGAAEREGIAVDLKPLNVGWRLGYVRPVEALKAAA
jgi:hypothetical protein